MAGAARPTRSVRIVALLLTTAMLLTGLMTVWNAGAGAQDGTDFAGTAVAENTPTPYVEPTPTPTPEPVDRLEPAFMDGHYRIVLQRAERGAEIEELELGARTGREWVAVVVDVINFSTLSTSLSPSRFKLRLAGGEVGGMARVTTQQTAELLSMNPRNVGDDVLLQSGDSRRFVFVFQIDAGQRDPALVYQFNALPLENRMAMDLGFDDLPPVASAPSLSAAVVLDVVDGDTVVLGGGLEGERTMYGVDPPTGDDCFASQAEERLRSVINFNVLVEEIEGEDEVYLWLPFQEGNRVLINHDMVVSGHADSEIGPGAVFYDWFADGQAVARLRTSGLWGICTSPHGVNRPTTIEQGTFAVSWDGGDSTSPYYPWTEWSPVILPMPDGGAIVFFSAERPASLDPSTPTPAEALVRRIVYSIYDPANGTWSTAEPIPADGNLQFGVSAVVDSIGRVHIVYSVRQVDAPAALSTLKYMVREVNGAWSRPENVGANSRAGHQISPSLAIDRDDTLHVVWQDQRRFSEEVRAQMPAAADVFYSLKRSGSDWATPAPVNTHSDQELTNRPLLVVDGARLVVVWSVYLMENLSSANRVDWSYIAIDEIGDEPAESPWADALPLIAGRGEAFGGRLLDLEASPAGGVVFVFGRQNNDTFLFLRRLPALSTAWSGDILVTFGDRGTFPALTVSADGTAYVVYSLGTGAEVRVAGVALAHGSIVPGPEVILTGGIEGLQGIPGITTDATALPWVVYIGQSPGASSADNVQAIRNFIIPRSIAELRAILGEED
jgi:endonuclease YncB( thermonuclease family)